MVLFLLPHTPYGRFARVRLLRHALPISLLILRKKTLLFCSLSFRGCFSFSQCFQAGVFSSLSPPPTPLILTCPIFSSLFEFRKESRGLSRRSKSERPLLTGNNITLSRAKHSMNIRAPEEDACTAGYVYTDGLPFARHC